jgi:hypothetical protein
MDLRLHRVATGPRGFLLSARSSRNFYALQHDPAAAELFLEKPIPMRLAIRDHTWDCVIID